MPNPYRQEGPHRWYHLLIVPFFACWVLAYALASCLTGRKLRLLAALLAFALVIWLYFQVSPSPGLTSKPHADCDPTEMTLECNGVRPR